MNGSDMTPGYLTTEFWLTLTGMVIPILVLTGVIGGDEANTIHNAVAESIKNSAALVAAAGVLWKYIHSRAAVKVAVHSQSQ